MPRIRGNTQYVFSLKTAAGSVIDFGADVITVSFTEGDGPITSGDKATGVRPVVLNATVALDTAATGATSLFEYMNVNAGVTGVTYVVQLSNAAVSQTNPKWTGTLTMPPRPIFDSGEMSDSVVTFEFVANTDSYQKLAS